MDFEVRRAAVGDAEPIARVQVESWRTTYAGIVPQEYLRALDVDIRAQSWTEQLEAGKMTAFVAETAAGIFGFVCGGALRGATDEQEAELYAIYLLREHQRHGAGRRLALSLASALRAEGFKSMAVWVLEQNHPAINFYRQLGAVQLASKPIEIGGAQLTELGFGWPNLESLT
jgi:ribosomal protein S18 acetylase RimI-like enzyme